MKPRRPKLAPVPDITTAPWPQVLAVAVKTTRSLPYPQLAHLLGLSEYMTRRLCHDEDVMLSSETHGKILALAAQTLSVSLGALASWIRQRGRDDVYDALVAAITPTNPLKQLRSHQNVDACTAAQSLGISRQRYHKLETGPATGVAFKRAYARALEIWAA